MGKVTIEVPESITEIFCEKNALQGFFDRLIIKWMCDDIKNIIESFPLNEDYETRQMLKHYTKIFDAVKDIIGGEDFKDFE